MRMEELSESVYLKQADTVESYLLGLVEEYFKVTERTPASSMERVVERCMARIDEELEYDGVGVTGIMLEGDTEPRIGSVRITKEEIGAEPLITDKRTAFNVDFGNTNNTACAGDDPRLSDKRMPLDHDHEMSDIQGLEGRLSTIDGKISRLLNSAHEHWNMTVLDRLVYSGSRERIDLKDFEDLENSISDRESLIRQNVDSAKEDILDLIDNINRSTANISETCNEVYQYITENSERLLAEANAQSDTNHAAAVSEINEALEDYATRDDIAELNAIMSEIYFPVGSMEILSSDYCNFDDGMDIYEEIDIRQDLLDEVTARGQNLDDCLFQFMITYRSDNKTKVQHMPYIMLAEEKDRVTGFYSAAVNTETAKLILMAQCNDGAGYTEECRSSSIRLLILSKKDNPLGLEVDDDETDEGT